MIEGNKYCSRYPRWKKKVMLVGVKWVTCFRINLAVK